MLGISKQTSDATNGAVVLKEISDRNEFKASSRISHNATLDGECVLVHSGFAECDRKISVTASISKAQESILDTIYKNETLVTVSTKHGCYSAAIDRLNLKNGIAQLSIIIKEKLSS